MTIEEISKAKREAEARIQHELQQLQEKTGMDMNVRYLHMVEIGGFERKLVATVGIDLRVP